MKKINSAQIGRMLFLFFTIFFSIAAASSPIQHSHCHPPINPELAQYVVGYGSLMQDDSKNTTYKGTSENLPITLSGFQRGWFARGDSSHQTFLGVIKNKASQLNAVVFKLPSSSSIAYYDQREAHYCRVLVPSSAIQMLNQLEMPDGQIWIYMPKPEMLATPSSSYPIMQSYVDIFLSGCVEIEKKYGLKNFSVRCVNATSDWSQFWINDRAHPARVLLYHLDYLHIDQLLINKIPTRREASNNYFYKTSKDLTQGF